MISDTSDDVIYYAVESQWESSNYSCTTSKVVNNCSLSSCKSSCNQYQVNTPDSAMDTHRSESRVALRWHQTVASYLQGFHPQQLWRHFPSVYSPFVRWFIFFFVIFSFLRDHRIGKSLAGYSVRSRNSLLRKHVKRANRTAISTWSDVMINIRVTCAPASFCVNKNHINGWLLVGHVGRSDMWWRLGDAAVCSTVMLLI